MIGFISKQARAAASIFSAQTRARADQPDCSGRHPQCSSRTAHCRLSTRVKNDGTTLVVISGADVCAQQLAGAGVLRFAGVQKLGIDWLGGNLFVRKHPLFKELPVNEGMNWEYQDVAAYDSRRYGLILDGEEVVAGTVNFNEPRLGTAVGVVDYGRGKIVLSTLDMKFLNTDSPGADVVRKILCNYIEFAGGRAR